MGRRELQRALASALSEVRAVTSRNTAAASFEASLAEAIFQLDSEFKLEKGPTTPGILVKEGRIQQIQQLQVRLFGEDGEGGLLDQVKCYLSSVED
jgi:hypothetical protein